MSTIIIGAQTQVNFQHLDCVVSVNWNYNPNPQRLYCLGEWTARHTIQKPTWTASLTGYSPSTTYDVGVSTGCVDVQDRPLLISPADCGDDIASISGDFAVSGYSYSKGDPNAPAQETWNLTRWVASPGADGTPAPDYVLRGIVEGTATEPVDITGIEFDEDTKIEASAGSVSANSIGKADITYHGVILKIGGGLSPAGETGNGNANIPLTPLWI